MQTHRAYRLAAAVLVAGCGCSFVAVRRPPPAPPAPDVPVECTQSRVAPALDTAGAIVTPIVGVAVWWLCSVTSVMSSWGSDSKPLNCRPLLWGTVLSTAAYAGSAVYGFHTTGECRRFAEQRRAIAPEPGPGTPGARKLCVDLPSGESPPPAHAEPIERWFRRQAAPVPGRDHG